MLLSLPTTALWGNHEDLQTLNLKGDLYTQSTMPFLPFTGCFVLFLSYMAVSCHANSHVCCVMLSWCSSNEGLLTEFETFFTQLTVIWLYGRAFYLKMCLVLLLRVCSLTLHGYFLTHWLHLNWAFENAIQASLIPRANNSASWQTCWYWEVS